MNQSDLEFYQGRYTGNEYKIREDEKEKIIREGTGKQHLPNICKPSLEKLYAAIESIKRYLEELMKEAKQGKSRQ